MKKMESSSTIECLSLIQNQLEKTYLAPYMLFLFEDLVSERRIYFCTHDEWSSNYVKFGLIDGCQLYSLGKLLLDRSKTRSVILPWWEVESNTKIQKEVVGARHEHGIGDGISIAKEIIGFRACLGIAPSPRCKYFSNLYLSNPYIFRKCFSEGVRLSIREMVEKKWVCSATELKLLQGMGVLH